MFVFSRGLAACSSWKAGKFQFKVKVTSCIWCWSRDEDRGFQSTSLLPQHGTKQGLWCFKCPQQRCDGSVRLILQMTAQTLSANRPGFVITHFKLEDLSYIQLSVSVSLLLNMGDDELKPVGRLWQRKLCTDRKSSFFSSLAPTTTRQHLFKHIIPVWPVITRASWYGV